MSSTPLFLAAGLGVLTLALLPVSEACFASGICGGGGGGGCALPPPPVCGGGCGAGYGCGQYGCYRLRARVASSKTLRLPERPTDGANAEDAFESRPGSGSSEGAATTRRRQPVTPDEKFMACCEDRNLPDACLSKCTFATYTRNALQNMYFRADPCPLQAAADMQFCAAQGRDHRACCARNGVATTLAGEKCLTFCNQIPGNVTQLDMSYMSCYDRFENMKGCFWHDLTRRQRLAV